MQKNVHHDQNKLGYAGAFDGFSDLPELLQIKISNNPCWLSFRLNYLALCFNGPVYDTIAERFGLARMEFVILYSLARKDGVAAKDICQSSAFPKNTVSRAVQTLKTLGHIRRQADRRDGRSYILWLTESGRAIVNAATPAMVDFEEMMVLSLDTSEQQQLKNLLTKMVIASQHWPRDRMPALLPLKGEERDRERNRV